MKQVKSDNKKIKTQMHRMRAVERDLVKALEESEMKVKKAWRTVRIEEKAMGARMRELSTQQSELLYENYTKQDLIDEMRYNMDCQMISNDEWQMKVSERNEELENKIEELQRKYEDREKSYQMERVILENEAVKYAMRCTDMETKLKKQRDEVKIPS